MLNHTSSFYRPKEVPQNEIDFTVMGVDQRASKVLNWTMKYFDNCEFLKDSNFMESTSMMVAAHFNDLKVIMKVEKPDIQKRA